MNDHIRQLGRRLACPAEPVRVPVRPPKGAVRSDCFGNVQRLTEEHGGEIVHGWCLWMVPDIWVEAEFHAVWRPTGGGSMVDVTPKPDGKDEILFLPDTTRAYSGSAPPNEFALNLDKPLVREFVELSTPRTKFIETHRPLGGVDVALEGDDVTVFQEVEDARRLLLEIIEAGASRKASSPCGSGVVYKRCHEKSLKKLIEHLKRSRIG